MKKLLCFTFIFVLLGAGNVSYGLSVKINLEKMSSVANNIVAGRCVQVVKGKHPQYKNVNVTYVTLELFDSLKGQTGSSMTFMQYGHGRRSHVSTYNEGEEMLIFLYKESQYGFTSPIGGDQGKFVLKTDPLTGERTIAGGLNKALLTGLDYAKFGLSNNEDNYSTSNETVTNYNAFSGLVKSILVQQNKMEVAK